MPEATEELAIWPAHSSDWLRLGRLWQRSRQFSLVLAAVDNPDYRDGLIARLNALAPAPQITLHAQDTPHDWLLHLQHAAATAPDPSVLRVHVCFPPHRTRDATWWQRLNGLREPLAAAFAGTLLVWLDDADISIAAHEAPDLWNWRTAVLHFVTPPLESLQSPAV